MTFLPPDYEAPAGSSRYMKFKDGDNVFRILDSAVTGMELWINHRPVRKRMSDPFTREELESADPERDGGIGKPKHFWAFPIIDRSDSTVKILEVTQRSVQDGIKGLVDDEDWGDPTKYDIKVSRSVVKERTTYLVSSKPTKSLSEKELEMWNEVKKQGFSLQSLFTGDDPFSASKLNEVNIDDIPFE